ncbi:MAG: M23 family metallopeptidase [Oscillospiraceae bacterium]|nr:M23 family metallopeptidase [Oscillospiraceae bacterium]
MEAFYADQEANQDVLNKLQADGDALQAKISSTLAKIAEEERKAREEAEKNKKPATNIVYSSGTYQWPSNSTLVTSEFGDRSSPTEGASSNHKALDIGAARGSNVYAADSGQVVTATYSSSYGNYIIINHGGGRSTLYGHMSKLKVSKGDTVTKGQVIGLVGSTGISTGPHLHFETRVDGVPVNPRNYFK